MLIPVSAKVVTANIADRVFKSAGRDLRVNFVPFLDINHVKILHSENKLNDLLEDFVIARDNYAKNSNAVLINGLDISAETPFAADRFLT
jgi:hypothetical protein